MNYKEFKRDNYLISTDPSKIQLKVVHEFLADSYWAKNIPIELVKKSLDNSLCFSLFNDDLQIGFARLVTDYATFAYLADVFVLDKYRGNGLSKWMMEIIINFPDVQGLRTWILKTWDAHGLYEKYGFSSPKFPERVMEYSQLKNGY